jgi:branched-chain amino acid transport system substrate-binding protein
MRKQTKIILGIVAVVAVVVGILFLSKPKQYSDNDTVAIGAILPLTGSSASAAEYAKQGIELAITQLNSNRPPSAPELQVEYADSKNAAKDGLAAFNHLYSARGIRFLMATNSGVVVPLASAVGSREDILLMTTFSSAPGIPKSGPNIFRLFVTAENEASAMSRFLNGRQVTKAAVFYINDDFGLGGLEAFTRDYGAAGGTVVWKESWRKDGTDFRSSLQKLPKDAQALYIIGYEAGLGLSVKQAREAGYTGIICTTVGMSLPPWRAAAGEAAEGVFFTNTDYTPASTRLETKNFVDAFRSKHGSAPNSFSAFAYEMAMSLGLAVQDQAKSGLPIEASFLSKKLQSMQPRPSSLGLIRFGEERDANPELSIWTIRNGQEQPADEYTPTL